MQQQCIPQCKQEVGIGVVPGWPHPTVCGACEAANLKKEKDAFLANLDALSLVQRVARLEEVLYDLEKRLSTPSLTRF